MNVTDGARSRAFYRSTLGALGLSESVDDHGRAEYGRDGNSDFGFYTEPRAFFQHAHVAFVADSRDEVDRFYAAALANGGTSLDEPRERPEFGFYSAYVRDPEGNGVEVACRLDAPAT
jgi:catechol 2,3-dioxygenase-like lactoylglutathione lyase family enzyme